MNFKSIGVKYSIPIVAMGLATIIVFLSYSQLTNHIEREASTFPSEFMPAVSLVLNGDRDLYQARVAEQQLVFGTGNQSAVTELQENAQQAYDRFMQYKRLMSSYPDIIRQLSEFETLYNAWLSSIEQVKQLSASGDLERARQLSNGASEERFQALRTVFDVAGELAFSRANQLKDEIEAQNSFFKAIAAICIILVIIACSVVAFLSQRSLLLRINEITQRIEEIASGGGDLTQTIVKKHNDELGALGDAFNSFIQSLASLINDIRHQVHDLSDASDSLKKSADSTTEIVKAQCSDSDMIVSAVHEMSMATIEMSSIAQKTAENMELAKLSAEKGVSVIADSVKQINSVHQSIESASTSAHKLSENSEKISDVLNVIRGIAEQTNLLALNAAIEAARAGEQGRGFAVVADEVRSLASKTQDSTENIQSMIQEVQSGVDNVVAVVQKVFDEVGVTVTLSKETEEHINNALNTVDNVFEMSIQTATATEEQTAVAEDINRNLTSLNEKTNLTSEEANRTRNAATLISDKSQSISVSIGKFKTH
ncbi:methyl-accepting chemotaxis protein [Planctobacterium marinum]|uniref:methyl-accepting chemotaxis protein n=1 Tax=Planctobacterium marinum TaxID=1631968 RepID=UPI001E33D754|nr:methyl-accepting chemotaxis protein [Planctobacterium marinum]MCC2604972.1 methyl-accepting chemotaxis protein [Planctobacterium marinum]